MSRSLSPILNGYQSFLITGLPNNGGFINSYIAGTSTPVVTYPTKNGTPNNGTSIQLNSGGFPPQQIWLIDGIAYKLVVTDSSGNIINTYDNIVSIGTTSFSENNNVMDFGAVGDGVTDDGPAFRAAVAGLPTVGGQVFAPAPTVSYLVKAAVGDTTNTAITVGSHIRVSGANKVATLIIPGANNTVCFRVTGLYGGIDNLGIDNPNAYTSVSGIRLAPPDESNTTTHSDIEFNNLYNLSIRNVAEAITLRPGPNVMGQDSYLYYNTFDTISIRNSTRGIWLKVSPNGGGGANANNFFAVRCGETGMNTGYQIDLGSENNFFGCAAEGIASGTSPNTTPTGLIVATGTGSSTANNCLYNFRIEGCTLDMELNSNIETQFYGLLNTGTINGTPAIMINDLGISYFAQNVNNGSRLSINFPDNGDGVRFGNSSATTANTFFSCNLSGGGGPTGYLEFLYLQNQQVLTWGGASSAYSGNLRLSNPLSNKPLYLGTQGVDRIEIDATGNLFPSADNAYSCGASGQRWTAVWAANGTIQTSDENLKQDISPIDGRALRAWGKVKFTQFKYKDAVAAKGDKARWHTGLIAQRVEQAFIEEGLNPFGYGLLCKDILDDGSERYSMNYSEALAFECAYLRDLMESHLAGFH